MTCVIDYVKQIWISIRVGEVKVVSTMTHWNRGFNPHPYVPKEADKHVPKLPKEQSCLFTIRNAKSETYILTHCIGHTSIS